MKIVVEVSNPRESTYFTSNDAWDVDVVLTGDVEERGEATLAWDEGNGCYGSIDQAFSDHLVTLMERLSRFDRAQLRQEIECLAGEVILDNGRSTGEVDVGND